MRTDGEPAIREVRLAVARELTEHHVIKLIQQNTPKYDSVKQVKAKVRVLVTGARELHHATIDRSHVTLPWCIRFAGQVLSRTVKDHDGLPASNVRIKSPILDPFLQHGARRFCTWRLPRERHS